MIPDIAMRSASEGEGVILSQCQCCSELTLQRAPLRPFSGVLDSRPTASASETGLGRLAVPTYSYERLGTSRRRTRETSRKRRSKEMSEPLAIA